MARQLRGGVAGRLGGGLEKKTTDIGASDRHPRRRSPIASAAARCSPAPRPCARAPQPSRSPPRPALLFLLAGVREPVELPARLFLPTGAPCCHRTILQRVSSPVLRPSSSPAPTPLAGHGSAHLLLT
ncbi:hypothetical protein SEVIR_9G113500v4 [Setaria viridis]